MKKFWSDYCEWGAYLIGIIVAFVIVYYLAIPILLYIFIFPIIAVIATCIFEVVKHFPKTSISVIICVICGFWYYNHIEELKHKSHEVLREKDDQYSSVDSEFRHCVDRIAYCNAKIRYCKENLSYYEEHLKKLKSYHLYNDLDNESAIWVTKFNIENYKNDIKECSVEKDSLTNIIDDYLIQLKVKHKELVTLYNNHNKEFDCHCEMLHYDKYYKMSQNEVNKLIKHNADSIYEKNVYF